MRSIASTVAPTLGAAGLQPAPIAVCAAAGAGRRIVLALGDGPAILMPVVIGVLMLTGIVTKNSILLVEYAIVARRQPGVGRLDAVIDACHKHARPIVMTHLCHGGAGMLPNALGLGAEPSFRQPMAIVVIGGLITSTFVSLLVGPVVFTYVDDLLLWAGRDSLAAACRPLTAMP